MSGMSSSCQKNDWNRRCERRGILHPGAFVHGVSCEQLGDGAVSFFLRTRCLSHRRKSCWKRWCQRRRRRSWSHWCCSSQCTRGCMMASWRCLLVEALSPNFHCLGSGGLEGLVRSWNLTVGGGTIG